MNPAKPTNLKILQGNPGKKALNKNEPKPCYSIPECPSNLDALAQKIWKRTGVKLLSIGCISEIDETMFALYCQLYANWLQLTKAVKKEGMFVIIPVKDRYGEPVMINGEMLTEEIKNPKQTEARQIVVQLKTLAAEFGMSPSSRSRISVDIPGGEEGDLESWEKKKHVG